MPRAAGGLSEVLGSGIVGDCVGILIVDGDVNAAHSN